MTDLTARLNAQHEEALAEAAQAQRDARDAEQVALMTRELRGGE